MCSTYYHVLIAIIRTISENHKWDLFLTDYISDREKLARRIAAQSIFHRVIISPDITEYQLARRINNLLFLHSRNRKYLEKQIPLDLTEYSEIAIFHDDTWMSHYLKDCKIPYILLEDALDSFRYIDQSPFAYMLPSPTFKYHLKKFLGVGYRFFQESKYVQKIEVNCRTGLKIRSDERVVERPRKPMFDVLTQNQKEKLLAIFLDKPFEINAQSGTLLLTQPLYADRMVSSLDEQREIYWHVIKKRIPGDEPLYIKPHPRDCCDYPEKGCVLLNRYFPVEILNYIEGLHFQRVITFFSAAARTLEIADEKICIGLEELRKIQEEIRNV